MGFRFANSWDSVLKLPERDPNAETSRMQTSALSRKTRNSLRGQRAAGIADPMLNLWTKEDSGWT